MTDLIIKGDARFSECGKYRYRLWRVWDETRRPFVYIMLNPSVGNEQDDDATIRRCIRRAERLGAGGIIVMNLFAFVATKRAKSMRRRIRSALIRMRSCSTPAGARCT